MNGIPPQPRINRVGGRSLAKHEWCDGTKLLPLSIHVAGPLKGIIGATTSPFPGPLVVLIADTLLGTNRGENSTIHVSQGLEIFTVKPLIVTNAIIDLLSTRLRGGNEQTSRPR